MAWVGNATGAYRPPGLRSEGVLYPTPPPPSGMPVSPPLSAAAASNRFTTARTATESAFQPPVTAVAAAAFLPPFKHSPGSGGACGCVGNAAGAYPHACVGMRLAVYMGPQHVPV